METTQETTGAAAENVATAHINPLERRLDLFIPVAEIDQEVDRELKRIAKTAKLPGFRPGKAPLKLIAQMYGGQARVDAISAAIEKAFRAEVRQQNLRVAGAPRVEAKDSASEGQLAFTATFEVYPEIAIADLSAHSLEKPVHVLSEEDVDKTIEVLRKQRMRYHPVDRPARKEDRLTIDFVGRQDGKELPRGKAEDFRVIVGTGQMIADFEAALEGMVKGQEKTFDATFPADYHATELAGKTINFTVTVKEVAEPRLPEVDAEFARALGIADGDLEKLRAEVRSNLEREVKKRLFARVKSQAMDLLLATHPITAPAALVEAEAAQMAENALNDLKDRNPQLAKLPVAPDWFKDQAERRVKLGLIIAELARVKGLAPNAQEVRAVIDEFAAAYEEPKEVVRWYYADPKRLAQAEALAMENKVVDWVLQNVQVSEKPIGFEELMGGAE